MKLKIALSLLLISIPLYAADQSVIATIESYEQSLNPLEELAGTFASDPAFAGKIMNICIEGECVLLDLTQGVMEKGGLPETISKSSWAGDVATVVKAATGGVSGSASVKVKVTHTETDKDGKSKSTTVEVGIEVKGSK